MEKKRRQQTPHAQAAKLWTGAIFAAFLAAAGVYVALLQAEKSMLSGHEQAEVYLAVKDIPAGQLVTGERLKDYVKLASVDAGLVPATALKNLEEGAGLVAVTTIEKGVPLTAGMFRSMDEITGNMKEPVVAGFRADDLSQVAGGVLRAGDHIHVYSSEEEAGTSLIWEDVYVQQVFDAKGTAIGNEDQTTAAQRINVFLDKEDVEEFYTRLDQGSLRVVKIWKRDEEK